MSYPYNSDSPSSGNGPYGDVPTPINGTLILVLGIIGLVLIPLLAPVAWIMGNSAVKTVGASPDQLSQANIGRILGIIGTVFMIIGVVVFVAFGGAIMATVLHAAASQQVH